MDNIINIDNYRKENLFLSVLSDKTRIGMTYKFILKTSVKKLKVFHDLEVENYFDFVDVTVNSIDYLIDSEKEFNKLLDNYNLIC